MGKKVSFCSVCLKWFVDIQSHTRNKHPEHNNQKVGCDLCQNNSVFTVSALQKHRKMVHNLVPAQNNKSVNTGETPLDSAAKNGNLDICKSPAKNQDDPLHSGAKSGQSQKKNTHPANQNGETPHQSAAKSGHLDICKSSAQNKESVNVVINVQENVHVKDISANTNKNINLANNNGETPHLSAAKNGLEKIDEKPNTAPIGIDSTESKKIYQCDICQKIFGVSVKIFNRHLKTISHRKNSEKQQERIEKENFLQQMKIENEGINKMNANPAKLVQGKPKTSRSKKRKINEEDSNDDEFDNEDFYIETTKQPEMTETNGCKSCDKKARNIELPDWGFGNGKIIPDEKQLEKYNRVELCIIINLIRGSYNDNLSWMNIHYKDIKEQIENYKLYEYECSKCSGIFKFPEELEVHIATVHEEQNQSKLVTVSKQAPINDEGAKKQDHLDGDEAINKIEKGIYLENIKIMAGYEKNNKSLVKSNQSLEKKNQNLETSNQTYAKCNQILVNKNQALKKEVKDLNESINDSADENTKMIAEMEKTLDIEIEDLQNQNKAWKKTQTSENEMEVLNQNLEKKNQSLEKNNQNLEKKNQSLEMSNQNLEKKTQTLENEIEVLNQGLIEYQSIGEREDKNTKLIAELEKKNQNLERQNQSLIEYQSTQDNNTKVIVFQELLEDPLETVPEQVYDNDQGAKEQDKAEGSFNEAIPELESDIETILPSLIDSEIQEPDACHESADKEVGNKPPKTPEISQSNSDVEFHGFVSSVHDGKKSFKCAICDSHYKSQDELNEHKKSVHDGKKPFKCDICHSSYNHEDELIGHMISVHDGKKPFKCDNCDSNFKSESELNIHMKSVHDGKKSFKSTKAHISSVHEENKFLHCEECVISFSCQKSLHEHNLSVHEQKKPYKCSVCSYNFASTSYLQRHIAAIHGTNLKKRKELESVEGQEASKLRKISCSYCGKTFPKNQNLMFHVNAIHEKKKPFKCETCGDCFGTKQRLGSHINSVHSEIKEQFPCSLCDKTYSRKDKLSSHLKTTHKK